MTYIGYGIAFDEVGSSSFGNDFAWNVIIFGFDNSSSSHTDNRKNNLLVQDEGPKNVDFPTKFSLWSISNNFGAADSRQVSLKKCVRFFSRLQWYL